MGLWPSHHRAFPGGAIACVFAIAFPHALHRYYVRCSADEFVVPFLPRWEVRWRVPIALWISVSLELPTWVSVTSKVTLNEFVRLNQCPIRAFMKLICPRSPNDEAVNMRAESLVGFPRDGPPHADVARTCGYSTWIAHAGLLGSNAQLLPVGSPHQDWHNLVHPPLLLQDIGS